MVWDLHGIELINPHLQVLMSQQCMDTTVLLSSQDYRGIGRQVYWQSSSNCMMLPMMYKQAIVIAIDYRASLFYVMCIV